LSIDSATSKPYGVFEELSKEKKYFNFDEIRTTIESETDKVAGSSKGIVDKPLKLTGINISTQFTPTSVLILPLSTCPASQKFQSGTKTRTLRELPPRWLIDIVKRKELSFWQLSPPMLTWPLLRVCTWPDNGTQKASELWV
jgi:hypothetical protein